MEGNFPRRHPSSCYGGANGNLRNNGTREQEQLYMPISNVMKVMRRALPSNAKVADNAKATVQECISEFINFITNEANERCRSEQRKTLNAEDLLWALGRLGFDDYIAPLSLYLTRYREIESGRTSVRGQPLEVPPFGPGYDYSLPGDYAQMGQVVVDLGEVIGVPVPMPIPMPMPISSIPMPMPISSIPMPVDAEFGGDEDKYFRGGYDVGASSSSCPALPDFDPYADLK